MLSLLLLAVLADAPEPPTPTDPSLVVELVASEPDIATPTGLAVDREGRVYVAESNTHFRPEGYDRPAKDRIRLFEDADHDGRFERIDTAYEGLTHTMSLAFEVDGALLVATRSEVFRLRLGPDGKATSREPIARLDTPGDYPHNGLSGLAVAFDGTIWFGLGENLGADYTLSDQHGTTLTGGEGGHVFHIRPDASGLTRVASGFWNPFAIAIDPFGRVFAVDNDPDSRPPCRLLHVVEGGDYGFRFRNGRRGLNPLTAWDGDLPGTLPMVAGTGEAPSGVLWYESNGLTEADRASLLVTSWGDHRIDRFTLEPVGASFRARREPIVTGGEHFRPVALAVGPDGSLYVTDWADRSYTLHGKGRVWRIRRKVPKESPHFGGHPILAALQGVDRSRREGVARLLMQEDDSRKILSDAASSQRPEIRALSYEALASASRELIPESAQGDPDPAARAVALRLMPSAKLDLIALAGPDSPPPVQAVALRRLASPRPEALEAVRDGLCSGDPFVALAAREGLHGCLEPAGIVGLAHDPNPAIRVGALLALADSRPGAVAAIPVLPDALSDTDPTVRLTAVLVIADHNLVAFKDELPKAIASGFVTDRLLRATLAAMGRLEDDDNDGDVPFDPKVVAALALDAGRPASVRALALRLLDPTDPALPADRLRSLLDAPEPAIRLDALRKIRERPDLASFGPFDPLALDRNQPEPIRAEAIAALSGSSPEEAAALVRLLDDPSPSIRRQAARSLRGVALDEEGRKRLEAAGLADLASPGETTWAAAILDDPASLAPGDPAEGARIFYHPKGPTCYRCHTVEGRGGAVGPDLSVIAKGSDARKIVESILAPSREMAPQFTPYLIARPDGTLVQGMLMVEHGDGSNLYRDADGRTFTLRADEREEVRPVETSIMPEDLAALMTLQELRDLVAFLLDPRAAESAP